jgi:hypothetical protein
MDYNMQHDRPMLGYLFQPQDIQNLIIPSLPLIWRKCWEDRLWEFSAHDYSTQGGKLGKSGGELCFHIQ